MQRVFIHGLESSSQGNKGRYFAERFPDMLIRDYTGDLAERLRQFGDVLAELDDLILVGSSFGGLMATIFAMENNDAVARIVAGVDRIEEPQLEIPAKNDPFDQRPENDRGGDGQNQHRGDGDELVAPLDVLERLVGAQPLPEENGQDQ